MRNRITPVLFLVVALALPLFYGCGDKGQSEAHVQMPDPEVGVFTMEAGQVALTTVLPGRISAHEVSDVRPQVGGIVQKRLFAEGTDVRAGETLYQLDPATFQATYDNAKAALAKAEANALPARLKAERYSGLAATGAVSKQENDEVQALRHQYEAEVVAARAALETARINLGYTRVTAPISGRIGKSSVTPGALVTANQETALATIQRIDSVYVDVTQSGAELLRLKREFASGRLKKTSGGAAKVRLLFEDGSEYGQEGSLQFSDITVDQSTGVITLRAVFPNANHDLLPGMYVRAVLEEGVEEQALLAPQAAIIRDAKGQGSVLLVTAENTVESRPVLTGRLLGDKILIADGLKAGDRVIIDGLQKVRPGAKVRIAQPAPAASSPDGAPAQPAAGDAPAKS